MNTSLNPTCRYLLQGWSKTNHKRELLAVAHVASRPVITNTSYALVS